MGMTIDEAIKQLETYSIPCGKYKEAYDFAIDTMRKYQKIQEIVKEWREFDLEYYSCDAMMNIERIIGGSEMKERELLNECEMLKSDIDRMMVTQDPTELNDLYEWASNRLRIIYHENMDRFKSDKEGARNDEKLEI